MEVYEWRDAPPAEFTVLGDPVDHSLSPLMHGAWLELAGRPDRYVAIRVPLDDLEPALARLSAQGSIGCNLTLPLKERAAKLVTTLDEAARATRAVNTIRFRDRAGFQTDSGGILDALEPHSLPARARVLVLGAGGSGRAAVYALQRLEAEVSIWNRTAERAQEAAAELHAEAVLSPDVADRDLIVNCTDGTRDVELPIDWGAARKDALAFDLMYGRETPFLKGAAQAGLRTLDGVDMLVAQGARSMEIWTGVAPERSVMRHAVLRALT